MDIKDLIIQAPKAAAKSTTIARAKFIRGLSAAIALVDAVGVTMLLTICPEEHRAGIELAIGILGVAGMLLNIDRAEGLIGERKRRHDLFGPEDGIANTAEEAVWWIGSNKEVFEKIKKSLSKEEGTNGI